MNPENRDPLEARLRALADAIPTDPGLAGRVVAQITAADVRPRSSRSVQLRRWIMRSAIGLAATAAVAAAVWSLVGTPRPAFAVEDVIGRLRSLHSLHLKGVVAGGKYTGGPHPIEFFIREPDCMRFDGQTVNENGRIRILDLAYAPDRFTMIDHTKREVRTVQISPPVDTTAPRLPADLRSQVADQLQMFLQMMFGPDQSAGGFHRVRTEAINGTATDVYQCAVTDGGTITVWFNPATRLPVRTEYGAVMFDTIEADPVIPDAVFHPAVPVGYAVAQVKRAPTTKSDAETCGSCVVDSFHMGVTSLLTLPGGNLLVCWHLFDSRAPGDDLRLPDAHARVTFTSSNRVTYTEQLLHADETPAGWHWRWSLLRPTTPPPQGAMTALTAALTRNDRGGGGFLTNLALAFPPDTLPAKVEALQQFTLPPGATPMTLEQIEAAGKTK
jgi:hypothetical protein